jgi:hypothetical protein
MKHLVFALAIVLAAIAISSHSDGASYDPRACCSTLAGTCTYSLDRCGQVADGSFLISVPIYGVDEAYSPPAMYVYTTSDYGYARGTCIYIGNVTTPQYCWLLNPSSSNQKQRTNEYGFFASGNGAYAQYAPQVAECYLEALGDGPPIGGQQCTPVYGGVHGDCCTPRLVLTSVPGLSQGAPTFWKTPVYLAPVDGYRMAP